MILEDKQKLIELEQKIKELGDKIKGSKRRINNTNNKAKIKSDLQNKIEKIFKKSEKKTHRDRIQRPGRALLADDYRVPRETTVLYASLTFVFLIIGFLSLATFFAFLIIIAISILVVKTKQGQLLGQAIRVSETQPLDVYPEAEVAAKRLSMNILPDIFVSQNPFINAYALGFLGKKSVLLNSKTVESMSKEELKFILGHEFSHIKCNHTNWMVVTGSAEGIKIPIISSLVGFILLKWSRMAEFTADRGGLLASRDINASVYALAKLAVGEELCKKLNIDKMFEQKEDINFISNVAETLVGHPYLINRIHALNNFYKSEKYAKFSQI